MKMNQNPSTPRTATSIDEVLDQLADIIQHCIDSKSYLLLFAHVYRETTAAVKAAILDGKFEDGPRMEKMDVLFANLYISAYYNFINNKRIPSSWNIAFKAQNERLATIQHILLGMNAHINHDLAIAAAQVAKGDKIIVLKNDFMTINHILAGLTNEMQKGLGKISFLMRILDIVGFSKDEKIINFSIKKARDFAWINAMELALLDGKLVEARKNQIDLRVVEISHLIQDPPGKLLNFILNIMTLFEVKDPVKIIKKLK